MISPAKLVKKVNAIHCLAVASKVLAAANDRLQSTDSPQFTEAGNNFYLMKTDTIAKILNSDKFGDYLLNILQTASAEDLDIAKAVTDFHKSI